MVNVEPPSVPWLVHLINGYAPQPRHAAGEDRAPYPDLTSDPPGIEAMTKRDLICIARRLWPVFGTVSDTERATLLNDLLEDAALSPRVDEHTTVSWTTSGVGARLLLAGCVVALLEATQAHGWQRLGTCAGDACVDVYVDEIGRGTRRYCSTTCLNRARVRAYRSRQRAASD